MRERRSAIASRIDVLEGLERSHEGLSTGVREVYALLEQPDDPAWRDNVLGLVADFLTVRREFAPLIDLVLGERAQRFLVRDLAALTEALRRREQPLSGRVSFMPVSPAPAPPRPGVKGNEVMAPDLTPMAAASVLPGVIAPAERVVRCDDPRFGDLPSRLLGRTLIVRDVAAATALAGQAAGFRCVTLQGELLEADGTVTLGTHHAEGGILSRKSELRDLRDEVHIFDERLAELEKDLTDLRERIAELDSDVSRKQTEIDVLTEQAADLRSRIGHHKQRRDGLHEEVQVNRSELSGLDREIANLEATLETGRTEAQSAEELVRTLQDRLANAEREVRRLEGARQQWQTHTLAAKVGAGSG